MVERPDLEKLGQIAAECGYLGCITSGETSALITYALALESDNARLAAELAGARKVAELGRAYLASEVDISSGARVYETVTARIAARDAFRAALARLGGGG